MSNNAQKLSSEFVNFYEKMITYLRQHPSKLKELQQNKTGGKSRKSKSMRGGSLTQHLLDIINISAGLLFALFAYSFLHAQGTKEEKINNAIETVQQMSSNPAEAISVLKNKPEFYEQIQENKFVDEDELVGMLPNSFHDESKNESSKIYSNIKNKLESFKTQEVPSIESEKDISDFVRALISGKPLRVTVNKSDELSDSDSDSDDKIVIVRKGPTRKRGGRRKRKRKCTRKRRFSGKTRR